MKKISTLLKNIALASFLLLSSSLSYAQCGPGQSSLDIAIDLTNDFFPDENGWIIVNTNTGAGVDSACFGVYSLVTGIENITLCLDTGITYSLYAMDDFGDGLDGAEYRLAFTFGSGIDTIGVNNFNIARTLCTPAYTNNEIADSTSFYVPYIAPPNCLDPDSLTVTAITTTTADLNWRENNSAIEWEIQYDSIGFTLGTGIDSIVSTNPKTITGLTPDIEYEFYVRSICGVGDTSGWSVVETFKTAFACPAGAVCATYNTGVIQTDRGFTSLPGTSTCPGTLSLTIPAGNRIDSISTRYDMTAFAAPNNAWMSEQRSWLYSVDAATGEAALSNGVGTTAGTMSYNRTGITIANGLTGVADFELHAGRTFGGAACDVDYSEVDNGSWSVIAYYSLAPACLEPLSVFASSVTGDSAQLNWAATGIATEWIVEWDTTGFTAGTGLNSVVVNTDTFTTITGLVELSTYDFYVRAICGPADTSSYSPAGIINTPCDALTAPFSETFDNTTIPSCWTQSAVSGGPWVFGTPGFSWNTSGCANSTPADNTGNSGNYAAMDHSATDVGVVLQLPDVDVSALTTPFLEFYFNMCGDGYTPINILNVEAFNGTSWDTVSSIQRGTNGWELFGLNLSAFTFNTDLVRIRFRAESGGSGSDFYGDNAIDDVSIDEAPSCPNPANLAATSVTSTDADLVWTENGTATTWEIEFGTSGYTPGTGTDSLVTANPFNWTGLTPTTSYDYYVRAVCSVGDTSDWVGPYTFTTECPASFTAPLFLDFENDVLDAPPACWLEYKSYTNGFVEVEDFTGTAAPFEGNQALYIYSSSGFTQGSDTLIAITPQLSDLSAGDKQIRFQANSDDPLTELIIGTIASPNPSSTFNGIDTINFPTPDTYQEVIVQFNTANGYNGTDEYIVFAHNLSETFDYIRIDALNYEEIPSCPKPSAPAFDAITDSSVVISWTNGGTETEWEIEYDIAGFTQGTGNIISTTTNPDTITGLQSATLYDFYIRAVCAVGDSSIFTSALSGSTRISPAQGVSCASGSSAVVFSDDLESTNGWTGDIGTGSTVEQWNYDASGTGSSNTGPSAAYSGTQYVYVETSGAGVGDSVSFISPAIDLSNANDFAELSFWLHAYGADIGTLNVGVGTSATGPFTEEFSYTGEVQSDELDPFENVGVNLDAYVGQTIYIEFLYITNGSFEGDIALDLIEVSACVTPPTPAYAIGTINGEDSLGVADSLNVNCRISGTVTGVDRRGGGYEFALIDLSSGFQEGITVFDFNDLSNYTNPTEGDSLEIYGSVDQFNGLTQFRPDSIIILDSGNATVPTPNLVTNLDETTESKLVELNDKFVLLDPSGSFSYNMDATNGTDTITIRVDSDTDVNDSLNVAGNALIAGDTICTLIGIGGQFDNSSPYDDGYQVFPSRYSDITICRLACVDPTALSSSNVSSDSASLSWTANGAAINWEISYGATGFTAGNGTQVIVNSNPFNLLNLSPNAAYDWYVRSICGVGDTSNWSDTSSFTTLARPLPYYPIGTINTVDTIGVGDSIGVEMQTSGTVVGVDLDGNNGLNFYIIDMSSSSQEGINIFNFNDVSNYVVTEGDSIRVWGEVDQFNGQQQIFVDSIEVISTNAFVPAARGVNNLDESTEANHISLTDDFVLLDASGTFSYNMDATNGIDTITIRVDADTDVNDSLNNAGQNLVVGDTICGLTGVGGQFDNSSPFDGGYQVFPMRFSDITICRLAVGLNDVAPEQSTFSIVPNPSSGEFSIRTSGFNNESVRIQIRDISGRMVMDEIVINAQNQMNKTIHLNENAKGIYFISIFDGDQIINQKLILK